MMIWIMLNIFALKLLTWHQQQSPFSYPLNNPNLIVFEICRILSRKTYRPLNKNVTLHGTVNWIILQYSVMVRKWKSVLSLFTFVINDLLISHRLAQKDLLVISKNQLFKQTFFSLRTNFSLIILSFLKKINLWYFNRFY